jgi:hypothetical protein
LKAPTIGYSDKPLDADDWLRVIETKTDLIVYTGEECVAIAAHQLDGSAKSWWDNYAASHPNPIFITWLGFCMAICKQYLPSELLVQTNQEFCTMTQGAMRVKEYKSHFVKNDALRSRGHQPRTEEAVLFPARPSPRPSPRTEGR